MCLADCIVVSGWAQDDVVNTWRLDDRIPLSCVNTFTIAELFTEDFCSWQAIIRRFSLYDSTSTRHSHVTLAFETLTTTSHGSSVEPQIPQMVLKSNAHHWPHYPLILSCVGRSLGDSENFGIYSMRNARNGQQCNKSHASQIYFFQMLVRVNDLHSKIANTYNSVVLRNGTTYIYLRTFKRMWSCSN